MPANITPIFAKAPLSEAVNISNTAAVPTTAVGALTLLNGGTEGARIHSLHVCYAGTLSATNTVLVFINDKLVICAMLPAHTFSTTAATRTVDLLDQEWIDPNDKALLIPAGATLKVGMGATAAAPMYVVAQGGYY